MADVRICLSTWSLHASLGPMRLTQRDAACRKVPWLREHPETLALLDLPAEARRRLGVDRLEICQMHIPSREDAYLDALARALAEAGTSVVGVPIDVGNISAADPAWRAEDCAEIEGWIDVAARLGAPMVRVNLNGAPPFADDPIAGLDATVGSLRRLVAYAAARDVRVLIENHGGISRDPETILAILAAVDGLGLALDVGNFEPALSAQGGRGSLADLDPRPLYAAIERVAPRATIVHAKTERFDPAGRHLGWDVVRALRIVRAAGFAGDVSIEYGGGGDEWSNAALTMRAIEEAFA